MHPMARITTAALGALAALAPAPARPASAAVSTTLTWTAPGDDGMVGVAQEYSLRYSTTPITEVSFGTATAVPGLPAPQPAGSTETFTVTGLTANTLYFFAVKTRDDAGNWSALSNVATSTPVTVGLKDTPAEFSFRAPWPNPARAALRFGFTLPRPAMVEVDAFGINGRRVRRLARGRRPAGHEEIDWDLRDETGRRVPAGVYLLRARLDGTVRSWRVAVVR